MTSPQSSAPSSSSSPAPGDDRIRIFDTTLRDGEQSPGASMNLAEKLEIARALAGMGVDVIEAGFPIASIGDFEAVRAIAAEVAGSTVCGLARCNDRDIDRAWEAVQFAQQPRIHVFLATSPIHREHKLRMSREQVVERAVAGVRRAVALSHDVEFSPEDAGRTEPEFLREVIEAVIEAGATTVNIPDTVGYLMPAQYAAMIRDLIANVPNIGRAVVSTHCHDDLGMAVANSLAGVEAGARQVECTINGIGERAGNAALEEIVMAIKTRHDYFGVDTSIKTERLYPVSRMLSTITGLAVQRNKAIVGRNAFAHESGIHQDGMLKERSTYEIMRPQDVGVPRTDLVLGKHSGRHALRDRIVEMGYTLSDEQVQTVFDDFKALADKKKEIYDEDLAVLVEKHLGDVPASWQLVSLHTTAGTSVLPTATVSIRRPDGEIVQDAAIGDGPVDAIFKAFERVTGVHANLHEFVVRSVSQGKDAQGEVTLELEVESDATSFRGRAASTDIIEASALAYLNAVNAITARKDRGQVREVVGRPGAGL
ncbi:2-isopropylmalate synthase [Planctomyces sp. SH-PL62]|uniref:2-isopropylmalate synthase n=1 Tax=Planctomyces sp. SH-PL62 TaxID=1636152 RepID=UPI00078E5C06|nr:2-isopropylmalate synthase [Planctomyces sp. SH-PL62]AMV37472.1 2-isopropylmalate synthase [Planctomyces sp. SH-PL62]